MEGYGPETYGERIADVYDEWHAERPGLGPSATEQCVAVLAELVAGAGGGRALELGIGTGRVALPLAATGVEVVGVDASPAMTERLRAKPGGDRIPVTLGDFADVPVDGRFALVYVMFNTFFALLTQEDQVRCFANVAARLDDAGVFVTETFVPDPARLAGGQSMEVLHVGADRVTIDVSRYDVVAQVIDAAHLVVTEPGVRLQPISLRYCWPAELDLMARVAGLRRRHRWADWSKAPFTPAATAHVTVWERAGSG